MRARTAVFLGSAAFTLAGVAFLASRKTPECYECLDFQPLISELRDAARRDFEDKDYQSALRKSGSLLKLDPHDPEILAISEGAASAIRELTRLVTAAREAVARGDAVQASEALERVLQLDPKNPVVTELAGRLNASFSARATAARVRMEEARSRAEAKKGAVLDPAFAEGEKFATAAGQRLADREFAGATQGFFQARDAFEKARRVIEDRERPKAAPSPARVASEPEPPQPCIAPLLDFCKTRSCPTYSESMAKVQERMSHDIQGWEFGACGEYRYIYLGDMLTYDTATRYFDSRGVLVAATSYWDASTGRAECPNWQHYGPRMECKNVATKKSTRQF